MSLFHLPQFLKPHISLSFNSSPLTLSLFPSLELVVHPSKRLGHVRRPVVLRWQRTARLRYREAAATRRSPSLRWQRTARRQRHQESTAGGLGRMGNTPFGFYFSFKRK